MINTAVCYMYTFSLIFWKNQWLLPVNHRMLPQLKAMVPAMYCQTFLHLIHQLAGHVKGNQRNMDRHLFSIKKRKKIGMYVFLILLISFLLHHKANCSTASYLENQYLKNLKLSLGPFYIGSFSEQSALRHPFQKTPKAWL